MVMRTRAPLSSAQPATRPFFAPGDPGLAPGVAGRPEVSADAFTASPIAGTATEPQLMGERAPTGKSEVSDREISAGASPPARATPPGGRSDAERDRRQESGETTGVAASPNRTGAGAASAGRDEVMSVATATPPAVPASPTDSTELPPPAPADPPPSPADRPPSPADRPPAPAGTAGRVRRRQQLLPPPANEPAVAAPAAAPEVTISIGHIDVRAAPPPAPARSRPAFRPRVSLDEFLAARQDRRP